MRILGVDPALKITGFGIIDADSNKFSLVKSGVIVTKPSEELTQRLSKIYDGFIGLVLEYKPEVMVIEKVYVHYQHPTTAYILGQARGIICLAAAKSSIHIVEYAATQVKKAITGTGHASKEQVQRVVAAILGMKISSGYLDVTDALALAIAYKYFQRVDKFKELLNSKR